MSITVLRGGRTGHRWTDTITKVKTTGDAEAVKIRFAMGASGGISDVMVMIDSNSFEALCIAMMRSNTGAALHTFARMIEAALDPKEGSLTRLSEEAA